MSITADGQGLAIALAASFAESGVTKQAEIDQVIGDSLLRLRSIRSVGVAVSRLPTVPAGFTRAIQASENAWRRIEEEFGFLTSTEVAELIGSKSPHRNLASELRKKGGLLGVDRLNSYRYPGFQFREGAVRPVIPVLLKAASDAGWSVPSLALWLCNPSGAFRGERPVDHLDDDNLVEIAGDVMVTDW